MKKNILITGGLGYIGGALTYQLLRTTKHNVTILDKGLWERGCLYNLMKEYGERLVIRPVDLLNNDSWFMVNFKEYDCLVHLAAIVGDYACDCVPEYSQKLNVDVTKRLVDLFEGRVIFASSCSNYGINSNFVNEESFLNPISLYARQKIECENYIMEKKQDFFICRFGTAMGGSFHTRMDLLVNSLAFEAWHDKKIELYGMNLYRPFVHVRDIARALVLLIEEEQKIGQIYNIGFNELCVNKYVLEDVLIKKQRPLTTVINNSNDDKRSYRVQFDKFNKHYDFKPTMTLLRTVEELYFLFDIGIINYYIYKKYNQQGLTDFYKSFGEKK